MNFISRLFCSLWYHYLRDPFNHVQALHDTRKRSIWYCKIKLVSICILRICLVSTTLFYLLHFNITIFPDFPLFSLALWLPCTPLVRKMLIHTHKLTLTGTDGIYQISIVIMSKSLFVTCKAFHRCSLLVFNIVILLTFLANSRDLKYLVQSFLLQELSMLISDTKRKIKNKRDLVLKYNCIYCWLM